MAINRRYGRDFSIRPHQRSDSDRPIVLLAGPSGCGKSHLAHRSGLPVVRLDDFYFDYDHPDLPRRHGIVDWDHPGSWDHSSALSALSQLAHTGEATVPQYSISESRRTGHHTIDAPRDSMILAEGIFAPSMLQRCQSKGLACRGYWIDRSRFGNFVRRLARDLKERRKSPSVLMRRGLALAHEESDLREDALRRGFEPISARAARRRLMRDNHR